MSATEHGSISTHVDGVVGNLIIDNAPRRNALSRAMYEAIPAACAALAAHEAVRVVVVRGAGDEAFSAGSNISEFADGRVGEEAVAFDRAEHAAHDAVADMTVPTIARVSGPCRGGGVGIALCCDLRITTPDASFAVPPAKLGIAYPPLALARLTAVIGEASARWLLLTASTIDADEAHRIGLVHEVVARDQLDSHLADLTRRMARLAPLSLRAAKVALAGDATAAADAAALCYASADYREGIDAFLEKRHPVFRGR